MIPAYIIELKEIPLTLNGKLNRQSLPEPEIKIGKDFIAPRNEIEKNLADVWSAVLGVNKIGINDNFFILGGDSIKTIQIQARMNDAGYKLNVKNIFVNPTISDLAPKIKLKIKEISQNVVSGDFNLTPIHHWFFNDENELNHNNQSVMLYSKEYLDENIIKVIFQKLQNHHDALRMTCRYSEGKYCLYIKDDLNFPLSLNIFNLENENDVSQKLTTYANSLQKSIDLENGPLMKLGLFRLSDGDRLLIIIHHLVIDGISWRIIFEDIETLYKQAKNGSELTLPLKSNSFREWSDRLTEYAKSKKLLSVPAIVFKGRGFYKTDNNAKSTNQVQKIDKENIKKDINKNTVKPVQKESNTNKPDKK